ncbi:hypothetical protein COV12_03345 [Candidatus Woesearchaeota archaeon CG10_big_fil_rev_8_21_14_0_10_32_24]|nr:MAG: hypothetical protein COV12_03345 [Candidatus Woesearchaeota archaeon CG10_big_fil_rev_8_21_14_0_10_32_24]
MKKKTFFLFLFVFIIISLTSSVIADYNLPIGILKSIEYNQSLAQEVLQNVSFFLAFLAGMTTLVSPCVLPLFPAYFAITFKERKNITLATSYFFVGFSSIFILMGLLATFLGKTIATVFSDLNWIIPIAGIILVIFGGMIFLGKGFPGLKISNKLGQDWKGLIASGALFAVGWTACVGPIISGVLLMISTFQNYGLAALLMLSYSLGIFVPLFILSFFYDQYHLEKISWLHKTIIFRIKGKEYHTTYPNAIAGLLFMLLGLVFILFRGTNFVNGLQFFGLKQNFYDWQNLFLEKSVLFNIIGFVVFVLFLGFLIHFIRKQIKKGI